MVPWVSQLCRLPLGVFFFPLFLPFFKQCVLAERDCCGQGWLAMGKRLLEDMARNESWRLLLCWKRHFSMVDVVFGCLDDFCWDFQSFLEMINMFS